MNSKKERKIAIVVIVVLVAIIAFVIISKTALKSGITCGQADEFNRSVCLSEAARMTNDSSYCAKIADHNLLYACRDRLWESDACTYALLIGKDCDSFWVSYAIKNKNISACNRAISQWQRDSCKFQMANLSITEGKNYCQICANVTSYGGVVSGNSVILNTSNPKQIEICDSISCFVVYANRTNDVEKACSLFTDKKQCANEVAIFTRNQA